MQDIMVDIETTGTRPEHSAILQIAAVRFDYDTGAVDGDMFCQSLAIPPSRCWDESTRNWWMKDKRNLLKQIMSTAAPHRQVLENFQNWVLQSEPSVKRFWSKPTHFDFTLIENYFREFEVASPFSYRHVVDVNTLVRLSAEDMNDLSLEKSIPFEGEAHNAIFDVLHQIKVVLAAKDLLNAKSSG